MIILPINLIIVELEKLDLQQGGLAEQKIAVGPYAVVQVETVHQEVEKVRLMKQAVEEMFAVAANEPTQTRSVEPFVLALIFDYQGKPQLKKQMGQQEEPYFDIVILDQRDEK